MAETKTFTAKVKLSPKDLAKSEELRKIPDNAIYSTVDSKGNDLKDDLTEISTKFELEIPTTEAEAKAAAKDLPLGGVIAIISERVVTKKRNEIAASMKPAENRTAVLKAELEAAKNQTQRLVAAQQAGDFELVKSIIAEMS